MPLVTAPPAPPATIHLMGICGTAMGAFAGMLQDLGYTVTGSDTGVYPPMSDYLAERGIPIMEGFKASNLDHAPDLVVVGNVIRAIYEEAVALRERDLPFTSMPAMLGAAFLDKAHSFVVSGTHGKTTTTSLLAWILASSGRDPGYLIGGVPANFPRSAHAGGGDYFVIEGDEYDTAYFDKQPKFIHYRPNTAILTSVEFDHADIYDDMDAVDAAFIRLVTSIPEDGHLIARWDDPGVRRVVADRCPGEVIPYGPEQLWDGRVKAIDPTTGRMTFVVTRDTVPVGEFTSDMVGDHNLYNQVAAIAAALTAGVDVAEVQAAIASFKGIKRRQEVLGEPGRVTVIDDFAHHPTAVKLTLEALRMRFGGRRIWAVWEPRSATSRRNVFQDDYAEAFDAADRIIIAPPHSQDGIPEAERFSSEQLIGALTTRGNYATSALGPDEIASLLASRVLPMDVVAILSNGGFGGIHQRLLHLLNERFQLSSSA